MRSPRLPVVALAPLALALALALVAPCAAAGTARRPDVEDDAGDQRGGRDADILAAWLEPRAEGLRFGIRLAEPDRTHHTYWVLLAFEETGREISAILGYGEDGVLRGALTTGPDSGGLDGSSSIFAAGSFERVANGRLADLRSSGDGPVVLEATIPWGSYAELQPDARLEGWMAGNTRYERGQWTGAADRADHPEPQTLSIETALLTRVSGGLLPILVPGWAMPLIVVAFALAGAGAGYGIARRKPRAPPSAGTARVPVQAPAAPGPRFRAAPPPAPPKR